MAKHKRLALFLDGTWNTINDNTNVWRMKSLSDAGPDQACYYSTGVGTQYGSYLLGGMFGKGLDDEVIRAYEWLIDNYVSNAQIFIFGFSRGAFTARSLAGLISICGLLRQGSPVSVNELYARYRRGHASSSIRELAHRDAANLSLEDRLLKKYSMPIPIYFQGVWDTVGALGIPFGTLPKVSRSNYAFLETDLRIDETYAYHALAIDEHREAFAPTLWKKVTPKVGDTYRPRDISAVEQRWFIGAHADVGGGYPNDLLPQIPLRWLLNKAASHGLQFTQTVTLDGTEKDGLVTDSFGQMLMGFYRLAKLNRPFYRPIGTDPIETAATITTNINETIDASVFERWRQDSKYRPPNLKEWAMRRNVDPSEFKTSVSVERELAVISETVDYIASAPAVPTV